ncbi:TadE/TadG family type IV pilus assembly protein [Paraburkholderia ginsengisoli]|uniref:Pilus assembly protein n=1 Tax=Paraburkholderia ginsengisoli TaxID=311231 RepID=A0A7T4T9W8_9BURK|nr:TadE/TadG family type IV pilus assembly protein [Paraburkholderia ginsengisoli]QQC64938.1 pilus assembly protein [Paraburkholderia ginsengisoli]
MKPLDTARPRRQRHSVHLRRTQAQRGATAIEFALVFPLFFMILYAIITFSLILVAQQNLTLAASEGARAALNWQTSTSVDDALTNRGNAACVAAKQMTATLVKSADCTATPSQCGTGMRCVTVQLSYDYQTNPLVPTLPLLGFAVPARLSSSATVQLNPENIQ